MDTKNKINKKLYNYYQNNPFKGSIYFQAKSIQNFKNKNCSIDIKTNVSYSFHCTKSQKDLSCHVLYSDYGNLIYSFNLDNENNYYAKYCVNVFNLLLLCMIYKKEV